MGSERLGGRLRAFLLAIVALAALGLLTELLLLEHWTSNVQLVPLATLAAVLAASGAVAARPRRRVLRTFRALMVWASVVGFVGIGFHLRDNLAFEREVTPEASVPHVTWHALRGATPLLAPGSLVQLGLIGLVFTYRHPALCTEGPTTRDEETT